MLKKYRLKVYSRAVDTTVSSIKQQFDRSVTSALLFYDTVTVIEILMKHDFEKLNKPVYRHYLGEMGYTTKITTMRFKYPQRYEYQ